MSPQESPSGAHNALRGSVRDPLGLSLGKPSAAKPRRLRYLTFEASGLPSENPLGALTV